MTGIRLGGLVTRHHRDQTGRPPQLDGRPIRTKSDHDSPLIVQNPKVHYGADLDGGVFVIRSFAFFSQSPCWSHMRRPGFAYVETVIPQ